MSQEKPQSDEDRLREAAVSAEKALDAQSTARSLRETASSITDPKKREKLLTDAYNKEIEAHGNSRKARMLSSGAFQGAMGGGGIGGAVGVGVGTIVGTLVGGVTSIPAMGVGALVGSGVGAVHGPFIKLGMGGGKKDNVESSEKKGEERSVGDHHTDKTTSSNNEDDIVPDPTSLREAADLIAEEGKKQQQDALGEDTKAKKRPRKLEIRAKHN